MDFEVAQIKRDRFRELQRQRVVMIVYDENTFRIEMWTPDSVAPPSSYETPAKAAARALQLLKITQPVTPQSWPEIAEIGDSGASPPLSS